MQEGKTLKWKITIGSRRRLEVVMGSHELDKPSSEFCAFEANFHLDIVLVHLEKNRKIMKWARKLDYKVAKSYGKEERHHNHNLLGRHVILSRVSQDSPARPREVPYRNGYLHYLTEHQLRHVDSALVGFRLSLTEC